MEKNAWKNTDSFVPPGLASDAQLKSREKHQLGKKTKREKQSLQICLLFFVEFAHFTSTGE